MSKAQVMKAIRLKCLECCCGNDAEVRRCVIPDCSLFPYRMGKDEESRRRKPGEMSATQALEIDKRIAMLRRKSKDGKLPEEHENPRASQYNTGQKDG